MKLKRTKKGWRFPCGIELGDHNLATMLSHIPTAERRLIINHFKLYPKVRESLARRAARSYSVYWNEIRHSQTRLDWWTLGGGAHRKHFFKAWYGYEHGFMPEAMLACAVAVRKAGRAFTFGKTVPPSGAFGAFVLSTLLDGWKPTDVNSELLKADGVPVQVPIPLNRAYNGPEAGKHMTRSKRPSRVWEPGLFFDPALGLYVPPELATDESIDVDAEEQ